MKAEKHFKEIREDGIRIVGNIRNTKLPDIEEPSSFRAGSVRAELSEISQKIDESVEKCENPTKALCLCNKAEGIWKCEGCKRLLRFKEGL